MEEKEITWLYLVFSLFEKEVFYFVQKKKQIA